MFERLDITSLDHYRILELCYRHAYLEARRDARRLSTEEWNELAATCCLLEGDVEASPGRRAHRRFQVRLPATIKGQALSEGLVLDVSAGGLYVASPGPAPVGSTVQVRVGAPSGVEYVYTGQVTRCDENDKWFGLGLSLCCVPLEMRRQKAA